MLVSGSVVMTMWMIMITTYEPSFMIHLRGPLFAGKTLQIVMEQVRKGWNTREIVTTEIYWKLNFPILKLPCLKQCLKVMFCRYLADEFFWGCKPSQTNSNEITWRMIDLAEKKHQHEIKQWSSATKINPQLSGEKTFFKNYRHPEIRIYDFPKHANQYSIYPTHLQLTEVLTPTLTPSMVGRNRPTRKCHTSRAVFVTSWTSSHTQKVRKLWILTNRLYHDWLVGGFNPIEKF